MAAICWLVLLVHVCFALTWMDISASTQSTIRGTKRNGFGGAEMPPIFTRSMRAVLCKGSGVQQELSYYPGLNKSCPIVRGSTRVIQLLFPLKRTPHFPPCTSFSDVSHNNILADKVSNTHGQLQRRPQLDAGDFLRYIPQLGGASLILICRN